jgi:putative addiction module component (TIGR02574 family)
MTTDQIRTAALKLDPVEREALAEELLLSVSDTDRETVDAAWLAEAHHRDAEFRAGKSTLSPVDAVISRLRQKAPR